MESTQNSEVVAVIGQGYVGLPLALSLASNGFIVIGIDISAEIVESLNSGISHIEDVSSSELYKLISDGNYSASTDFSVIKDATTCVICVPTPLGPTREPELAFIESALSLMAPHVRAGTLIVNESTSYPGTLRDFIVPTLRKFLGDKVDELLFASAPERIDPGNEKWSLESTPRIVSGIDEEATGRVLDFYKTICSEVTAVSSPEVAELSKLLENTFRQVNIALINQMVPVAHSMGIQIREVVDAAGTKPYGFMKFYPGAGVGGHCIPIDPLYLLWKASKLGLDLPFIRSADDINRSMPQYVSKRAVTLGSLKRGGRVLLLGVAYKSGVSDIRETPAKEVAQTLSEFGAQVFWFDPLVVNFKYAEKWQKNLDLNCAIIVTAQANLPVLDLLKAKIPILDCTGSYIGIPGIVQL